jgi:hypothetical protein
LFMRPIRFTGQSLSMKLTMGKFQTG